MTPEPREVAMARAYEFRVVWQREGLGKRTRIYQLRPAAERLAMKLEGRMAEVTGLDPDAYSCCSGYECGCHGVTNAQVWAEYEKNAPPLIYGPVVESRPVGIWSPVERGEVDGGQ